MNTYNQHIRIEEDGSQELYPFDYLEFYESNIHPYEDFKLGNESKRIYEGITASEFRKKHKAGFLNVMQEVLNDKRLEKLQEELETEEKQVCMFNLYILAMFLVERCKTRYVFLLKPTIQETLSALNNVSKITFTNRDGSIAESTSDILIQTLLDALEANKECDTDTCQVEKVVAWDKVANNSVMQSYFVHDLSAFLHEYFPVKRKKDAQISTKEVENFQALAGNGLTGTLEGHRLLGGSMKYISSQVTVGKQVKNQAQILAKQGKTPLLFAKDDVLIGMIAVADVIKEDSPKAVQELQNMGIRVVMLTGDNEQTAKAIGAQAGVDQVIAGVLPDGKEAVIRKLKEYGKVAMVGDGINDAPALTRADIGIAIGAGADVAIDAADVVLMKSRLSDVPAAVRLSRATLRNIHENLFWAFFYNIIGIPLAAGVWIPIFGWTLNPMFGALAMSLSSFCVVSNALRLNLFKVKDSHRDHKIKNEVTLPQWEASKGEKNMTKTMTIKGMMCGHCEARVKKTLEELEPKHR